MALMTSQKTRKPEEWMYGLSALPTIMNEESHHWEPYLARQNELT